MAFEEFGQLSKRRRAERSAKLRRNIIITVSAIFILCLIAAGVFAFLHFKNKPSKDNDSNNKSSSQPPKEDSNSSKKILEMVCSSTDFKKKCQDELSKAANGSLGSNVQPKAVANAAISAASKELGKAIEVIEKFKYEKPEEKAAYEVCKTLFEDAKEELEVAGSTADKPGMNQNNVQSRVQDLRTWLSAVASYTETCTDGFSDGELKKKMQEALNSTKGSVSNSLAIVSQLSSFLKLEKPGAARHLLAEEANGPSMGKDGLPQWMGREERKLLTKTTSNLTPNITVAKDGSGNFTTINDALKAVPEKRQGRFYIFVKQGIYEEYVTVTKEMANITIYGEGSQKSVVTGNKNFVDGVQTYQTATFAALGEGFTAMSMGFRNTAGPEKHQAVALRVQADKAIFLNCRMEAYQDTLYAQTHRQFYRGCVVAGTVDFIFGDAAAIFQNCLILVKKPLENQQNIITAQGRTIRFENTGIVLQKCKIQPHPDLEPEKQKFKTYLGRPWKLYSRTVVMESELSDIIQPEGWLPWQGDFALKTLYYAEYNNEGPGAAVDKRVNWAGYKKKISKEEAYRFTVTPFLQNGWIKESGVPLQLGFFK
ncbi:hypothetical protein Ancab_027596 [Ancistrocladus abbreviatus]